ncbi:family 43 glycosylhydrolase [Kribbella pittospori]|nr:family 43 glycosylhydrolase [Kribbella pittospori]
MGRTAPAPEEIPVTAYCRKLARSGRRLAVVWLALLAAVGVVAPVGTAPVSATEAAPAESTFQNPVSATPPGSLADPSVIRGRDGFWYSFTTARNITIQRSKDLISWEPAGTVFTDTTRPEWFRDTSTIWAPDVSWLEGRYVLTFSAIDTAVAPNPNRSIGVASAPTPTGPWVADPAPVIPPGTWQPFPDEPPRMQGIIDSELFTAPDGRRYLYYGGFNGGIFVQEVDGQVRQRIGAPVRVVAEDAYEAAYVVYRSGWYWLFYSTGNCCSGPNSGYTVVVSRSRSPRGPFVDRTGAQANSAYPGGTPVLTPNGNAWVGTGHSTQATDASGQDWLLYHGIDRNRPWYDMQTQKPLVRSMFADQLDWIDGWPVVRAGQFASENGAAPKPALIADPVEGISTPDPNTWVGAEGWTVRREQAGGYLHAEATGGELHLQARQTMNTDLRARASVRAPLGRGQVGLMLGEFRPGAGVRVTLDADRRALVVTDTTPAAREIKRVALPAATDPGSWHELDVRIRGRQLVVEISEAGLYDPQARVEVKLPRPLHSGSVRLVAAGAPVDVDDVTAAQLYQPITTREPDPAVGRLDPARSDEFDGPLGSDWSWVREPAADVLDGRLDFPVQAGDLTGDTDSASVLLREPPPGDWVVETKLTLDFGAVLDKRFPQAGLIVYRDDDDFLRLSLRGHGRTRTTEYGKESVQNLGPNSGSVLSLAGAAPTTWMRIAHTTDPSTGEGRYRAAISRDGRHWVWGMTYTLPAADAAGTRVGLFAHGGDRAQQAHFDYLRWYQPSGS